VAGIAAVFDQLPAGAKVALPDDCYQGVAGPGPGEPPDARCSAPPAERLWDDLAAQTQVLRQAREQVTEDAVLPPVLEPPMAVWYGG